MWEMLSYHQRNKVACSKLNIKGDYDCRSLKGKVTEGHTIQKTIAGEGGLPSKTDAQIRHSSSRYTTIMPHHLP